MTLNKKNLCVRVARWALLLEEYDYTVEHRPGKNMQHVDALSRNPIANVFLAQECRNGLIHRLRTAQHEDPDLKPLFNDDNAKKERFKVENGILFKEEDGDLKFVAPKKMQVEVIKDAHAQGHFAVGKTELLLKRDFWFSKMKAKIEEVIRNCVSCILAERKRGKQEGFLNPIDKGERPLDTYHLDHLGPIPSTRKNYRHIFAVVDAFSKYVWLYPTKSTGTEEVLTKLRMQAISFGNPKRIITDRGSAFTSLTFKEYCLQEGIKLQTITTGVPRGNGQIERVNRVLIPLLTKLADPKPDEWWKYVPKAQQFLNSTPSRSTGATPFELMIGIKMHLKDDKDIRRLIDEVNTATFNEEREQLRIVARENILHVQQQNKRNYDKSRKEATAYKAGQLVAIKRTQLGPGSKFRSKYLGPYQVKSILKNDRYKLEKVGNHDGPVTTHSSADHMKEWQMSTEDYFSEDDSDIEDDVNARMAEDVEF